MSIKTIKLFRTISKIFLILIGVGLVGYLGYRFYIFKPSRITVSNITSRSATISWVTDKEMPGMVLVREKNTILPIWVGKYGMIKGYDDRDYSFAELQTAEKTQENLIENVEEDRISIEDIETEIEINELGLYWTHHVTIRNLDPGKEYQFLVGDELVFKKGQVEENGNSFLTKEDPESVNTPLPAYGQIRYMYEDAFLGSSNTILYATLEDKINNIQSEMLSTVTNIKGNWYLDISSVMTQAGDDFWSKVNESDVSLVQINLIIEGGWMGRWSKVIDQLNSSPAESIDIFDPGDIDIDYKDEEIKFEGISYTQDIRRIFVRPSYAQGQCIQYVSGVGCVAYGKDNVNTAAKTEFARQTSSYANKAIVDVKKELAKPDVTAEKKVKLTTQLVQATADKENADKALADKTKVKTTDSVDRKKVIRKLVDDKVIDEDTAIKVETATIKTNLEDAKGDCGNFDVCVPDTNEILRCGWLNKASCNCVCGEADPVAVPYGGTCYCKGGEPIVGKTPVGLAPLDENSVPKDDMHRCPNDLQGGTLTCLSSNGCWYSEGYYSGRTFADHGYTCTAGKDGESWRWAGEGVAYLQYLEVEELEVEEPGLGSEINEENLVELIEGVGAVEGKIYVCNENKKSLTSGEFVIQNQHGLFRCTGGKFVKYEYPITIDKNKACPNFRQVTYFKDDSGVYTKYECTGSGEWVPKDEGSIVGFGNGSPVTKGGTCNSNIGGVCQCTTTITVPVVASRTGQYSVEKSLEKTVKQVYYIEKGKICGEVSGRESSQSNFIPSLVKRVLAAEEEYIINTEKGVYEQLGPGSYIFEIDGDSYLVEMSDGDDGKDIYLDINSNGVKDEGDVLVTNSFDTISVKTIRKEFVYNLKKGINLVSFPFVNYDPDIKMASDLLEYLNYEYLDSFYSIAKFDSGRWFVLGSSSGNDNQNDFQIIPGEGYVLKTKKDLKISIYGKEVKYESPGDSVSIGLYPGWNLMSIYGSKVKTYTARTLLEGITNYDKIDFTATNVSRWEESKSLYEGIQGEKNDQNMMEFYGLDFPISKQRAYFVKITEGSGNWEPELKEN